MRVLSGERNNRFVENFQKLRKRRAFACERALEASADLLRTCVRIHGRLVDRGQIISNGVEGRPAPLLKVVRGKLEGVHGDFLIAQPKLDASFHESTHNVSRGVRFLSPHYPT